MYWTRKLKYARNVAARRPRKRRATNPWEALMKSGHFVGATVAAALLCVGTARAQEFNFLLRGTFSVTIGQTCLLTIGGFNPDLTPTDFSFITTTTSVGTAVFNGDGTGSETLQEVSVTE